jgi:glutamate/aspartate transport system permease protein
VTLAYILMNFLIIRFMGWIRKRSALPGLMGN